MTVIAVQGEVTENSGIYTGGFANNIINGDEDANQIVGNALVDEIHGMGGSDNLSGEGGNDYLYGGLGKDSLLGGEGNDQIYGEDGDDDNQEGRSGLIGGGGDDYILGGDGNDYLEGNLNNDQLYGDDGNDLIYAGSGDDYLFGGPGNDSLHGEEDSDYIYSGDGNDEVYGGLGHDYINLGEGDDYAEAGDGNDNIVVVSGSNEIYGGAGDDFIQPGDGDIVDAGEGSETYGDTIMLEFSNYLEGVRIDLGQSTAQDIDRSIALERNFVITNVENVHGTIADDVLIGDDGNNLLVGSSGADILYGKGGTDVLELGEQNPAQDTVVIGVSGNSSVINFDPTLDIVALDAASCGAGLDGGMLTLGLLTAETDIVNITEFSNGVIYAGNPDAIGNNPLIRCAVEIYGSRIFYDADGDWSAGMQHIATLYQYEWHENIRYDSMIIHGYDVSSL